MSEKTKEEIEQEQAEVHLGMRHQTASARFTELKKSKRIKETCRRPTRTGRPAGVCVVNDG